MEFIIGRQGNQKLVITDTSVSRQHCKVTSNPDGSFTIENLSKNGTFVDGVKIIRKRIGMDAMLTLGPHFSKTLRELIGSDPEGSRENKKAPFNDNKKKAEQEPPTYSISHLAQVWNDYNDTNIQIANDQRKINLTRAGLAIFTMAAMPTIFFLGPVGYALTGIGLVGNVFSFLGMKNSETALDRQLRQDDFDDKWVCPNPKCGKTLPAKNYKMLVRNLSSCPYCKCKYIEK